jgi:di/tripeptidase
VTTAAPPRASASEREQLVREFVRLCEIESVSKNERAMADTVTAELRELGLDVAEDASARPHPSA